MKTAFLVKNCILNFFLGALFSCLYKNREHKLWHLLKNKNKKIHYKGLNNKLLLCSLDSILPQFYLSLLIHANLTFSIEPF